MVPPKVAMRTSPLPFSASGTVVCSGHAACPKLGRMKGAETRLAPTRPRVVRLPMVFLLMDAVLPVGWISKRGDFP